MSFAGLALDHAGRLSQFCFDDEAIAVLGHDVARISELCLLALALFGKLSLGEHLVNDASDQPQRVMLAHPLFEVHIGEQFTRPHIRTARLG